MHRTVIIATVVMLACTVGSADAISYTGTLSLGDGLEGTGKYADRWADTSISYNVERDEDLGLWRYEYTLDVPWWSPDLSHFIVSTSPTFTLEDNLQDANWSNILRGTYSSEDQGKSNPNMPAAIDGIKFDSLNGTTDTFWFYSDRDPILGDIYGKGGGGRWNYGEIWNTGLGDPSGAKIYVPDTTSTPTSPPVPEPASGTLAILGLTGLVSYVRRRRTR